MALLLFDLVLCVLLLLLAGAAMLSRSLTQAVTLFIAFGVMMALAWARLKAPDLALAEAAIGAGALCQTTGLSATGAVATTDFCHLSQCIITGQSLADPATNNLHRSCFGAATFTPKRG